MATSPDVSIIIPCHNAAGTLSETIASVQAQTLANWEAVCVDDASTDNTPAVLDRLRQSDARIRATRVEHRRPAATRNHGVRLARSERIFFLDADDLIRPEALGLLLNAAREAGNRAVVTSGFELLDQRGRPLSIMRFPSVPGTTPDAFLRSNRITSMTLVPTSALGPEPFDETLPACEDWELWLRLAHAGVRCVTLPRVLAGYRLQGGSLSHKADLNHAAGRQLLEKWLPHARDPEAVRDVRHRWACACGALALTSGDDGALRRHFADLPPLEPNDDFDVGVAGGIDWAYLLAHGAQGQTWRNNAERWQTEIATWLEDGPLASHADAIMDHLAHITRDPREHLGAARAFIGGRPGVKRVLVYGLGTNGLQLVEQLRAIPGFQSRDLCAADDYAAPLTFAALGPPREDPRRWQHWPQGTIAIITANDCRAMRTTLERAGGREGRDFLTLAANAAPAAPVAG